MLIRILIADDHTLFREMLREVLSRREEAYAVIGEATNGPEILQLVTHSQPDLLILDYKMPSLGRLSAFCKEVIRRSPATRILILSGYAEEEVALEAALGGAHRYILKGAPLADLLSAIATIYTGGIWLDEHLPLKVFRTFRHYGIGKASKLEI